MKLFPSETNHHVIGIGASAGGLDAMVKLFSNILPSGCFSFIIALHMAKDGHIGLILRVLSRECKLPIIEAKSNMLIEADRVYLLPPGYVGLLANSRIQLLPTDANYFSSPSVNALFNSIATDIGKNCIGIVLSGSGSDGLVGARSIKANGGQIIAQSPQSSVFPSMPSTIINSKVADRILAPEEMAQFLNSTINAKYSPTFSPPPYIGTDAPNPVIYTQNLQLSHLVKLIYQVTGVDFSNYKEETLLRRLERRIALLQLKDSEAYEAYINKNPEELHILQRLFLVSLSSFFRDFAAFSLVKNHLAQLLGQKKKGDFVRIWVPGCASGEECYSYAILLAEYLGNDFSNYKLEIIGTDLNPDALALAHDAIYSNSAFKEMEPTLLERYFEKNGRHYKVKQNIRGVCRFTQEDLISADAPTNLDLISCRNLLIYMKSNLQEKLFKKFHSALLPQGLLFIGQSENIGISGNSLFTTIDYFHRLYRRK